MPIKKASDYEQQLADDIAEFYDDPLGYVMYVFPWDTERSIQQVELPEPWASQFKCKWGPDRWACEFLEQLGEEVRKRGFDGRTPVDPIRFATASGHGIGKSTLTAWITKWIMDTRPHSKGVVTAGKADQLKTKTWAEVGKWHRLSLTRHWSQYNSGRGSMNLVSKEYPETWRVDAQTCKEENADSFAGLHAANSTPWYLFDEASAVPRKIFEVREGGLTDGEPMVFDFGNPTERDGAFYDNCDGKQKHRYIVRHIDSRDVAITNKKLFNEWIKDYGIDSDFCKVRIRGMFPDSSTLQFISDVEADMAMHRPDVPQSQLYDQACVLGVDVARFGDDESVIATRWGMDARSVPPLRYQKIDNKQLADRIIEHVSWLRSTGIEVAMIFIDVTGGYGGGVYDILFHLGYPVMAVEFGTTSIDPKYKYTTDMIWGRMRDAIRSGLRLPKRDLKKEEEADTAMALRAQLTGREYGYTATGDKIQLETKASLKKRQEPSPDIADAVACTFYMDIAPEYAQSAAGHHNMETNHDFHPYQHPVE